ncbi:MAG TPA: TAT-variant-translocated molybdopterin oxidoreductase [Pyrinomonadaceae bacterium]|nr:TAT-variant-translocated molybdopterin oxidoreductase [Pyrinomonadaceae bacterium]
MHIKDSFPELHQIRKPVKVEDLRERLEKKRGREYWRSLEELASSEEFDELLHREFPRQASEWDEGTDRRTFLKVMGASLAFAGLTGCVYQPPETIVPYVREPEGLIPGKPLFYATAMPMGGAATGLLVRSNEGRPTKVEGNELHPGSLGAADVYSQAAILQLYDPDRSETVRSRGELSTYTSFLSEVATRLEGQRDRQGAGLRFLTETVVSPTLGAQLRDVLRRYPAARWYQWEPAGANNASVGAQLATGDFATAVYDFTQADRVLALDSNFLECGPASLRYARDFASRRRVSDAPGAQAPTDAQQQGAQPSGVAQGTPAATGGQGAATPPPGGAVQPQGFDGSPGEICRLYAVESAPTNTGVFADHRLSVRPSEFDVIVRAVAAGLGVGAGDFSLKPEHAGFVRAVVEDLRAHGGRSIVIAGDEQGPVTHALALAMNQALGNVGRTVRFVEPVEESPTDQLQDLRTLISEIDAGAVEMLIILGGNPVYSTPPDLKLSRERMLRVPFTAHLSLYEDETSELCRWHIPETHFLEAWSDARGYDGTVTIMQPLIEPLYAGKSAHDVVAAFSENPQRTGYDIVREFWQTQGRSNPSGAGRPAAAQNRQAAAAGATAPPAGTQAAGAQAAGAQAGGGPAPAQDPGNRVTTQAPQGAQAPGAAAAGGAGTGATGGGTAAGAGGAGGAAAGDFEQFWRRALHDGVVPDSARRDRGATAGAAFTANLPPVAAPAAGGYEIVFRPDPCVYDGRFANNGWLQELPKPLTKLTWDNAALISPATAEALGVGKEPDGAVAQDGPRRVNNYTAKGGEIKAEVLRLQFRGREITAPVYILPGTPDGTVVLYLGYGRELAGRVGGDRDNLVGVNAYQLRPSDALWGGPGLSVTKTNQTYQLASTQIHFQLEGRGHEILHAGTYEEWRKDPALAHRGDAMGNPETQGEETTPHETMSLYPEFEYKEGERNSRGYKWGMMIDVATCVGCNACVVACQAENNIPVVGKEQVARSREMHWLRIDAYFSGAASNPGGVYFMPLPCMHCEKAPCEPVCPVHATVHSAEGLNDMIYNRCIGTRYCSNNCPYKVRRFNFLLYQDWNTPSLKMLRNPEVSIRSRGVMEKCTYCVQRIRTGEIEAEKEARKIRDGEVKTACQATCPTDAIIFGDLNDPGSRVARFAAQKRAYGVLDDLNTQPRTRYLASVRNPNPALEGKA